MRDALAVVPDTTDWSIVFEYELPLEGGRRPDVVVLAGSVVVAIEFKVGAVLPSRPMADQAAAYARDLAEYHEGTYGRIVHAFLVPTNARATDRGVSGTQVVSPDKLAGALQSVAELGTHDLDVWLRSAYAPLPRLVIAARRIFADEPLPHVRRARSAGIPEAVDLIQSIADDTRDAGARSLVFVAGVPGSGKTLVGLRAVYERTDSAPATFLSGNGPLVKVLQDALRSGVFVRDLHAYIRTYGLLGRDPNENLLVFDEAQRAWDRDYMRVKREVDRSEPELLLDAGSRMTPWSTLIGLVGDGQEIHSGEEGGLAQWADAARASGVEWRVICPPRLQGHFQSLLPHVYPELDLTVSLRSREAEVLHDWVQAVLDGSMEVAARIAATIGELRYPMYLTRDLEEARSYVRARYEDEDDARYGLVSSSHAKALPKFGVDNSFMASSTMNIARWFNAPLDDPDACVQLTKTVTEFGCQGLELDMPIVCWGEDLRWEGGQWSVKAIRRRYPLDSPEQIVKNVYRVLLTRGRDGYVVWVPPGETFDATAAALLASGLEPL